MSTITYTPGDYAGVAGSRAWMLLHARPGSEIVAAVWDQLQAANAIDALINGLLRVGLDRLPDFALVAEYGKRRHLLCRGTATATLVRGEAEAQERVDGHDLATWAEHPLGPDVHQVILGVDPAADAVTLPAGAGVFLASALTIDLKAASTVRGRARRASKAAAEPSISIPVQEPVPVATPQPTDSKATAAGPVDASATLDYRTTAPFLVESAVPETDAHAPHSDDDEGSYDFLFAATQNRTVEDAAVRPAEAEAEDELPEPAILAAPPAPPSSFDSIQPSVAPSEIPDLIDDVPWASPASTGNSPAQPAPFAPVAPVAPVAPAAPPAAPTEDEGFTVKRSELMKLTAQAVATDRIGPTVHALLCPMSHANPPSSSRCRLCDAALPEQDPVTVPRPVLGILRLSTGDVIALDRSVVMGRSPRTDLDGEDRPHVVKLPSADGEISRTHLQVTLDGWHVLVTDLKSTNGTLVTLPGRESEQLRPHDPLPIQPGTLVTLAGGVDFRYEVAE
jgi:hypothetical protein